MVNWRRLTLLLFLTQVEELGTTDVLMWTDFYKVLQIMWNVTSHCHWGHITSLIYFIVIGFIFNFVIFMEE